MQLPTSLSLFEYQVVTNHHTVPVANSFKDVQKSTYWQHVTRALKPGHRIVCDSEDGSWTCTLFVRSVGKVEAEVVVLSHNSFTDATKKNSDAFFTKFINQKQGWGVFSKVNGSEAKIQDGFQSESKANEWISASIESKKAS